MKRIFIILIFITANVLAQNSWQPTGLSTGQIRALTADSSGNLYAARWAVGIYKSTNEGVSWTLSGLNGKRVFSLATSPSGEIFAFASSTSNAEIYRSSDEGNTWLNVLTKSIPNNSAFGGGFEFGESGKIYAIHSFTAGPTVGDVGADLYISTNSGINWSNKGLVATGPTGGRFPSGFTQCLVLGENGKLFAGTSDFSLLYTTDDGNNWFEAGIPVLAYVLDLTKDSEGRIYAGLAGEGNNLFISSNNGVNWLSTNLNLPYFDLIEDLKVTKSDNALFVATQFNIFRSTDGGSTFDTLNSGFPLNASVMSLCNIPNGRIYAGTLANGVYSFGIPLGITNIGNIPTKYELHQNYPNPFNPVTKIRFSLPNTDNVKLEIYDVTGKLILELVNSKLNAGTYEINLNAASFSSGVYFYRIYASGYSNVKKMMLVK